MLYFFSFAAILSYVLVAWQDFRHRAVSWICFLLLLFVNISYSLWVLQMPVYALLQQAGLNALLIGSQLLLLKVYFSVRNRKIVAIADRYIGWGDIVLYATLCFLLPPLTFMCFHLLSLLFCLLLYMGLFLFRAAGSTRQVPLAGIQSCLLIVLMFLQYFLPYRLYEDTWLLNMFAHA